MCTVSTLQHILVCSLMLTHHCCFSFKNQLVLPFTRFLLESGLLCLPSRNNFLSLQLFVHVWSELMRLEDRFGNDQLVEEVILISLCSLLKICSLYMHVCMGKELKEACSLFCLSSQVIVCLDNVKGKCYSFAPDINTHALMNGVCFRRVSSISYFNNKANYLMPSCESLLVFDDFINGIAKMKIQYMVYDNLFN